MGALVSNGDVVKKRTVEGNLRNVAQIFVRKGDKEPCLDVLGGIDFRLPRQLRAYAWEDPPPDRVVPVPIALLPVCWRCLQYGYSHQRTIADLIYLSLFFLCDLSNITMEVRTHVWPPPCCMMFNFSSNPVALEHPTHPCPSSDSPPLWPSPSTTRRTQSTGSPSDMDAPSNTPASCAASSIGCYTSPRAFIPSKYPPSLSEQVAPWH